MLINYSGLEIAMNCKEILLSQALSHTNVLCNSTLFALEMPLNITLHISIHDICRKVITLSSNMTFKELFINLYSALSVRKLVGLIALI